MEGAGGVRAGVVSGEARRVEVREVRDGLLRQWFATPRVVS